MSYQFEPFDPSTISDEKPSDFLLMDGEGSFRVKSVLETESKQGNKQTKMILEVTDSTGKTADVFEYFPHLSTPFARWKITQFAKGVGDLNICKNGVLSNFLVGKTGKCIIATKKGTQPGLAWSIIDSYIKKDATGNTGYKDDLINNPDCFDDGSVPF